MTWCSEDSATPRFVLASSAIRCRFVDRFVRLRVLSHDRRSLAYLSVSSMLPPLRGQRRLQRVSYFGAIARLQHLLPTLQEWCCHHPCKARFRLAGLPLPGGGRTLWIALKGFRLHFRSPFLDLSWRYRDELPPPHS